MVNGIYPLTIFAKRFHGSGSRGGSRAAETSKMKPLTIITKRSILDVPAALDPPLGSTYFSMHLCIALWQSIAVKIRKNF